MAEPDKSPPAPPSEMIGDLATIIVTRPSTVQPSPNTCANPDAPVPFVFGRRIAQGGMGAIIEADDCKFGRKIAVKVMRLDKGASEEQKRRFVQEASVLGRLEHPNIVPVHDFGRDAEGELYYTMKLVKGRTLQDILDDLRREHPEVLAHYTLDRLLTIFRKVCDALSFANANHIIHRDLKPENIMVGEFGEVLVMDWGIAKVLGELGSQEGSVTGSDGILPSAMTGSHRSLDGTSSFTATMDGAVMGTPNYMSPEQAMGKVNELDERSDIFSLGGILYAILTLRPPVEGKNVWEVLEKVQMANITEPTKFGVTAEKGGAKARNDVLEAQQIKPLPHIPAGRVPPALSAVVMKALTLDKAKRYQQVAAFSADVEKYQGGFATSAENAGAWTQLKLLIKRNKGTFTTAAAAWLLITGLGVWFVFNLRAKEQRATKAEAVAVQERETARQALAKSQLDLAEKEFERGKFIEAQKILSETPESFRDANWRFLQAHSRDFTAQLTIPGKGSVARLQFLPQGDRFAVRCVHEAIGIFTLTGRHIGDWLQAPGHHSSTFGIDRTGSRIAFPAWKDHVSVKDVGDGTRVGWWPCELGDNKHVLLSPDGETALAAGKDQLIAYATQTGARLWTQPFSGVVPAFSPDGRTVAILASKADMDLKIHLLETTTGAVRSALEATADNPDKTTLQFNQAGDRLACLGGDEAILWDLQTARKIRTLHFPGETVKLMSPDGDTVATSSGSRIRLWDATTGRLLRSLNGGGTPVSALAFSPDGTMLLSSHRGGNDGVVHVWPVRLGEVTDSARPGQYTGRNVLFNHDHTRFYACAQGGAAGWDLENGLKTWEFSAQPRNFHGLAVHPTDGSIVLSEYGKKAFTHFSSNGEPLDAIGSNNHSSVKFNRSGQLLLAVDSAGSSNERQQGGAFSVMDYPSGNVLRKISTNPLHQPFAAFCLDDAAIATAARAGGITVWDWKTGTPLRQIAAAQTGSLSCLASSPDGRQLASGGPDRWIRVWEAASGRLETAFRAHWEGVSSIEFSPDGREILSGSEDGTVRIHDAATGEERLTFYGHTTPVVDVDISADGRLVAAITTDGFTKVWDRQRSSEAAQLPGLATSNQPVAASTPPVVKMPLEGEDLLVALAQDDLEKTGRGWNRKDGELFSPDTAFATLLLGGDLTNCSYQVNVKLRQLPAKNVFYVALPVANRMCGFSLESRPDGRIFTGIGLVEGKGVKEVPGAVEGKQMKDAEPHVLALTVRLDGAKATITTMLDGKELQAWTGPTVALSQGPDWAAVCESGRLALGTFDAGWAVSEVKVKRLDGGK